MTTHLERYQVYPVARPIQFEVRVPGSKSITNRALLLAALAEGDSTLSGVLFSSDSDHFIGCLTALGVQIDVDEANHVIRVAGTGGVFPNSRATINVGSAGTAARFLTAAVALNPGEFLVDASQQMQKRPMGHLLRALEQTGARFEFLGQTDYLPYRVHGVEPNIDRVVVDSTTTSQYLSALLLVGPLFPRPTIIAPQGIVPTESYVDITLRMIESFNGNLTLNDDGSYVTNPQAYKGIEYSIEPDVSSACYFAAAAAVTGGNVLLKDVFWSSMQGDVAFMRILEQMGCTVVEETEGLRVQGPPQGKLRGITVDMNDCADQALTLAAIAPFADSTVEIQNVEQIRHHESDRISAAATELQRLNIRCQELSDGLVIEPGQPRPATIQTYDDHRMAMAFSLVGLRADGIVIDDPDCTAKTFPTYFTVFDEMIKPYLD